MGWLILSVFSYVMLVFLFVFTLNLVWDKWMRGWLFEDKIDGKMENAKEDYVEQQLHDTLEKTLKPRRKDGSRK